MSIVVLFVQGLLIHIFQNTLVLLNKKNLCPVSASCCVFLCLFISCLNNVSILTFIAFFLGMFSLNMYFQRIFSISDIITLLAFYILLHMLRLNVLLQIIFSIAFEIALLTFEVDVFMERFYMSQNIALILRAEITMITLIVFKSMTFSHMLLKIFLFSEA